MSPEPKLTIAGNNDLASDTARHAISAGLADPVYLWRTIEDPIVGHAPIVILADQSERAWLATAALDAGIPAVSLPITNPDERLEQAILDGKLKLMSRLHGLPALARLHADSLAGLHGQRYGVYAAHRLPRNYAEDLDQTLQDLIVYITSLIDSPLTRVSATSSNLGGSATAVWFVLARFADDTIATIEVGAMLPDAAEPNGELLVEVTGSDAVLRSEPERQSIVVNGNKGLEQHSWYADAPELLLQHALTDLKGNQRECHISAMRLTQQLHPAAASDTAIPVG